MTRVGRHSFLITVLNLSAEIFGSLTSLVTDTSTLYRAHIRAVMAGMGYDPHLAETATQPG